MLNNAELISKTADTHGGNIYKLSRETGIPEEQIVDFSASINPLGVSARVKDALRREVENLVNYPDPDTGLLRDAIARHHDIDPETILCGNGSTELIYLIPRALNPGRVLIPSPTFSEYEKACNISDRLRVKSYELKKQDRLEIRPERFIQAMQGCDMAFLCNPNNPTGHVMAGNDIMKIAEAAEEMRCYLIVDEAFMDFCPEDSVVSQVVGSPYLIVVRSMTKFYALTGLRIGYGVFPKDLAVRLKACKEPWTVNHLAQAAARAALNDRRYVEQTREVMKREKEYLEHEFHKTGIDFLPSPVNFYLLRIRDAGNVISGLKKKGVLVRDCANFRGLDDSYIRVAVKSHEHNRILLKELEKLCAE
jgi:threonine-phosphate decarboxylase